MWRVTSSEVLFNEGLKSSLPLVDDLGGMHMFSGPQLWLSEPHFFSTACHGCRSNNPELTGGTRAPPNLNEPERCPKWKNKIDCQRQAQATAEQTACSCKCLHTYSRSVNVQNDGILLSQRFQFLWQTPNQWVYVNAWLNQLEADMFCSGRYLLELLKQTINVKWFP